MAVTSETRTIHTITVEVPDNVLGKIEAGDEVEVMFVNRDRSGGKTPRPIRVPYTMLNWLMGWGDRY